jgi:ABC-type glycerol-3-phosphate transport system substrate-binding protein
MILTFGKWITIGANTKGGRRRPAQICVESFPFLSTANESKEDLKMTLLRRYALPLFSAIVLVSLSVQQSVARSVHAAPKPVVVQYWENLSWHPAVDDMTAMVDAFNKSHPAIHIEARAFSNASVLQPAILAAIRAGHPPALSQTDAFAVATYVDEKAVQNLDPYINGAHGLTKAQIADYFKPQWQNGMYHGRMYSMPFNDTSVTVLWYNPKVLKTAHISTLPKTWTQFAADCAKVTKGTNWCMDTTDNEEPLQEPMIREWGGQLVNRKGTKAAFDSKAGIASLQYWVNLIKKHYVHKTDSSTTQWEQDFASGHVAFEIYSSEGATDTQSFIGTKFKMGAAEMPAGPKANIDGNGGDNIFMFKGAKPAVKAAAWEYIKWATQPKWTAWWSEHLDAAPVRKSAVKLMAGFLKTHPLDAAPIRELGRAYFSPTVSGWAQAQSDIDLEMSKAMLGEETSVQAMHNAAVKVNHDLATAG